MAGASGDLITNVEEQTVVTYIDDSGVMNAMLPLQVSTQPSVSVDESQSDIYQVLKRPVVVASGTWSVADAATPVTSFPWETAVGRLVNLKFPDDLFSANPAIVEKLRNYTFLRSNMKVRCMVNASPFCQGRLWMAFSPYQADVPATYTDNHAFLASITGFPGVEIDVASGTVGTLEIPFCSPLEAFNLVSSQGTFGELQIWILSQLTTSDVEYTVQAWLEDPVLSVPNPLSSLAFVTRDVYMNKAFPKIQAAGEATAATRGGFISGITGAVSSVAGALSVIPGLGTIAGPVSAVAGIASGVTGALGWCKPADVSLPQLQSLVPGVGFTHCAGIDRGVTLGLTQTTELKTTPDLFGTAQDEMSLAFVCKRACLYLPFKWDTADVSGDVISSWDVNPSVVHAAHPPNTVSGTNLYYPSLLAYATSMFGYWRGGLKYRMSVVKTAFHSGRLRITFIPGASATGQTIDNAYSYILDLRTSSELEFEVPFVSNTPWKPVNLAPYGNNFDSTYSTGTIRVEVLNALIAPDTVSPTIDVLIWISAGEGFELGGLGLGQHIYPVSGDTQAPVARSSGVDVCSESGPIKVQVLGDVNSSYDHLAEVSSGMKMFSASMSMDAADMTLGERIDHLRVAIKRFYYFKTITGEIDTLMHRFAPFERDWSHKYIYDEINSPSQIGSYNIIFASPLIQCAQMYRFVRGSMRYKLYPSSPAVTAGTVQVTVQNTPVAHIQTMLPGSVCEVTRPYFSNVSKQVVGLEGSYQWQCAVDNRTGTDLDVLVAPGDDFTFGWLIGAPIISL